MLIQGLNVEAVGNTRGFHETMEDGTRGPEFLGVWVEIRHQHNIKIRIMAKWVTEGNQNHIILVPPRGFGMSEQLNHEVCQIARAAIVHDIGDLERRHMADRNLRRVK